MAYTSISNLWTPDVWVQQLAEFYTGNSELLTSGAVQTDAQVERLISSGNNVVNMPFFAPFFADDASQKENTNIAVHNVAGKTQRAIVFFRELGFGMTALSKALSAADPLAYIYAVVTKTRDKNRQKLAIATLRGIFASAQFSGHIVNVANAGGTGGVLGLDTILDACAIFGEQSDKFAEGAVLLTHPKPVINMLKREAIDTIQDSQGRTVLKDYMNIKLIKDSSLVSDTGTGTNKYYEAYLIARGALMYGEAAQVAGDAGVGEVASLQLDLDKKANNVGLYDRTKFILHVLGSSWKSDNAAPASGKSSWENSEVQAGTWELVYDAEHFGVAKIVTNG